MANIVPNGSLITRYPSLVQLDAWNWEDAACKNDRHSFISAIIVVQTIRRTATNATSETLKKNMDRVDR
jgi:hypothetical protein